MYFFFLVILFITPITRLFYEMHWMIYQQKIYLFIQ